MSDAKKTPSPTSTIGIKPSSAVLDRLIREISGSWPPKPDAYNRTYNRHNR